MRRASNLTLLLAGLSACTSAGEEESGGGGEALATCDELAAAAPKPSGTATVLAVDHRTDPSHLCDDGAPLALEGDLWVIQTDWTDLSPLGCVESISGELYLASLYFLRSLEGADRLGSVGSLRVSALPQIDSLEPLAGVLLAGAAEVTIDDLPRLPDLSALRCTQAVDLTFKSLPSVEDFSGVPLQSPLHGLSAQELSVTSLDTLAGMTVEELTLDALPYLEDTSGLAEVTVTHKFTVAGSDRLASLLLPEGDDDGYSLEVEDNPALTQLMAPTHPANLRSVGLVDLPALTELEALTDQATMYSLSVRGTGLLTPGGFAGLVALDHDLDIRDNLGLTSLTGLSALQSVGGIVTITGNRALPEAEAEAFVAGLDVGVRSYVSDNGP